MNGTVQRSEMTYPAIEAGMVENQTVTTIKLDTTQFQQIDKSQFKKAPEFAQISGYINTPIPINASHIAPATHSDEIPQFILNAAKEARDDM